MTGYGEGRASPDGVHVLVTLRSVNHRGLDVRFALPAQLAAFEASWRKQVAAHCSRGRVEVKVSYDD